jgi:hypothetical protein
MLFRTYHIELSVGVKPLKFYNFSYIAIHQAFFSLMLHVLVCHLLLSFRVKKAEFEATLWVNVWTSPPVPSSRPTPTSGLIR